MSSPFIGEIRIFAGNYAPVGWAICDGSLQSIADNDALFALIGTTYGGDGQNTFALPDLRGRLPMHQGNNHILGESGGAETVTLSVSQLPSHSHALLASTTGSATSPTENVWAASAALQFVAGAPNSFPDPNAVSQTGSGQPHENRSPLLAVNFIISLFGIFPSIA